MKYSFKITQNVHIRKMLSLTVACALLFSLVFSGCGNAEAPAVQTDAENSGFLYSEKGDYDELINLISKQITDNKNSNSFQKDGDMAETAAGNSAAQDAGNGDDRDYSGTNNQVKGVDEADVIKTDGKDIFLLVNNRLVIVDSTNPENLKILSEIKWNEYSENTSSIVGESPVELYLDIPGKKLAVITQSFSYPRYIEPVPGVETDVGVDGEQIPPDYGEKSEIIETADIAMEEPDVRISPIGNEKIYITTYIYNVSNPSSPQLERSFVQEGNYVSSRKIDEYVYIVSQKYQYAVYDLAADTEPDPVKILPAVSQNGETDNWSVVEAEDVRIMPEGDMSNQLVIAGIDLNKPLNDADIKAVIGSTGIIYSSTENMYIAGARYVWNDKPGNAAEDTEAVGMPADIWMPTETYTDIYKFEVSKGVITEKGRGTVPGYLINQFSLDEYEGYLRIAVTDGQDWFSGQQNSENGIYILDGQLKIAGKITGLARGEMIKSVRFMGDKAWMVTFRTTDPLFGIDLSVPDSPKVLSELKLPGYSSYLHPITDNKLLGFGYDVEVDGDIAYEKGLKISLFDISDLSSPVELDNMILGERGSWSDIIYQHKSLMSDDSNYLYGFPATLNKNIEGDEFSFGSIYFQGLILLNVSSGKIDLKGGISHIDGLSDPADSTASVENGEYLAYGAGAVFRGVRIGNQVFTLSREKLQANDIDSLKITGFVQLPGADQEKDVYAYREAMIAEDEGSK